MRRQFKVKMRFIAMQHPSVHKKYLQHYSNTYYLQIMNEPNQRSNNFFFNAAYFNGDVSLLITLQFTFISESGNLQSLNQHKICSLLSCEDIYFIISFPAVGTKFNKIKSANLSAKHHL